MKLSPANWLWIAFLLVSALLAAQSANPQAAPQTATLQGIVIKQPGSEPVKKAVIELIAESQNDGGNYTAQTTADGSFRIEGIIPGGYHLFVERPGLLDLRDRNSHAEGRLLTLMAGQELNDLVVALQAAAVIEGRVTDEDGEPMPNAQVSVFRQTFVRGHPRWEAAGGERSNDLGEYRVANLSSGSYYISVTPPPDFRALIASTNQNKNAVQRPLGSRSVPTSYQTTYYPGTHDRSQSTPVRVRAGDDFPANFTLSQSPTLNIRGTVANIPAGSSPILTLQSRDGSLIVNLAEVHKDGSFEISGVSPGTYTILAAVENATAPLMARQILQVSSENVEGLRLAMQTGASVRGRVHLENNSNANRIDLSQVFLTLHSADDEDSAFGAGDFSPLTRVNPDGSLEWKNVLPGKYVLEISSEGNGAADPEMFLKSVNAGSRGPGDSDFAVSSGSLQIDVTVSGNGAVAQGVVATSNGDPAANAIVVAVPDPRSPNRLARFREAVADQNGRFTLHGLAPGDYRAFAWESLDGDAYLNSEFLRSFEGQGIALHVNEGERKNLQLSLIRTAEDQP